MSLGVEGWFYETTWLRRWQQRNNVCKYDKWWVVGISHTHEADADDTNVLVWDLGSWPTDVYPVATSGVVQYRTWYIRPSLSDHENENETGNFVFVFGKNDPTYLAAQTKTEISVLVGFTYRVVQYTGVHTYLPILCPHCCICKGV